MMAQAGSTLECAPFVLEIPPPKMMTTREELALARVALARSPESKLLRFRLLNLLVLVDEFDEAIAKAEGWQVADFSLLSILALAWLSKETHDGNLKAKDTSRRALEVSANSFERASALTTLAKAHTRLAEYDQARACLAEALSHRPAQKDAFKRTVALDLKEGSPQDALDLAGHMVEGGVTHARVLAARSLAYAQLGQMEEARQAQGLGEFLFQTRPAAPDGWESLDAFNRALQAEIAAHPDMRYERYGTASAHTWRVDQPALQRSQVFPDLQKLIQREVTGYVSRLPGSGHPFLEGRPRRAWLRNWSVIAEGTGHETWHVHQNGWLSGVYYVHVQDHIALGTGVEGCISFGLPDDLVGEERAIEFGERVFRPHSGFFMLFPSHVYHRTYPHHGSGKRMCVAFDIVPAPHGA